jgi:hypothetical protein
MRKALLYFLNFYIFILSVNAQDFNGFNAESLRETKWQYAYMLHVESNMVIHKAAKSYQYYIHFRFDQSYEQFLNGGSLMGGWQMSNNILDYSFQDIKQFKVVSLTPDVLVLEFQRPNSQGHFQYYFNNADENNPFPKPINELPLIKVREKRIYNLPWWATTARKGKKTIKNRTEPIYINIELIGGGYSNTLDPVTRDYIRIKSDGRLIQEYQSKSKGLITNKKNIPRAELEKFCEYVVQQNFFEFQREYDCHDQACEARKRYKPSPIPLRISIVYGNRKKVISLPIWGIDERKMKYVNYPPALDNIIDAIQRFAHRPNS